jgi:hypothetical protein
LQKHCYLQSCRYDNGHPTIKLDSPNSALGYFDQHPTAHARDTSIREMTVPEELPQLFDMSSNRHDRGQYLVARIVYLDSALDGADGSPGAPPDPWHSSGASANVRNLDETLTQDRLQQDCATSNPFIDLSWAAWIVHRLRLPGPLEGWRDDDDENVGGRPCKPAN